MERCRETFSLNDFLHDKEQNMVLHDIILAEMGAAPITTEALFRRVTIIHRLQELSNRRVLKFGTYIIKTKHVSPWYNSGGDGISPNNHWGIIQMSDQYQITLGAPEVEGP